jgi:hypothetical protein
MITIKHSEGADDTKLLSMTISNIIHGAETKCRQVDTGSAVAGH